MHENVLQSIINREPSSQQQHHYGNSLFLDDKPPMKNSAVVQPLQSHYNSLQKENVIHKPGCISPVLPGTGNLTHNITRMLFESTTTGKQPPIDPLRAGYQTYDLPGYYSKGYYHLNQATNDNRSKPEDDDIDVEGDHLDHLRTGDLPNTTDSSISTQESSSPSSSGSLKSPKSSPGSGSEPATSPEITETKNATKKARTNYTPEQIQTLMKIFHENPYPDSEMMETIGHDFGVPENKIKIWFQNKRARWRRRVNDNMNNYMQPFMPVPPMMSPMGPYGFMTSNPMNQMTSMNPMMRTSPTHGLPGYFKMPWMQAQGCTNGNQTLNKVNRYPQTPQHAHMTSQQLSPSAFPVSTGVSQFPLRTSPQQMTSQNGRHSQYPQYLYPPSYQSS